MLNPPNLGSLLNQASSLLVTARNNLQQILYLNAYLQALGVSGLVSLGMASGDATQLLLIYGHMAAVAEMCEGAPYTGPSLPFNFMAETVSLWAGQ